ncbi:MAG: TonB-dependent receptor, partial [bacterium]|nr:TonB-dependent receptor [bacterium]
MKLTVVYTILAALVCLPAAPQQTGDAVLSGRALTETGTPIAGAEVVVEPGGISVKTDRDGGFRIEGLPSGTVTVTVVAEHYYPSDMHQLNLTAGEAYAVEIELREKAVVQETVVVTGTGTEYLATEAPVRTELITNEMVESQVKTTLAEALTATIPGVRIETNCQNCGFTQLRMNGLEGPYTQILEDGLPNYSGVAAVYGLEQIPTAFIEQIEVVKGGNSALYGPGAVAGVVNLIRREPRENRFRIDTQAGWHRGRPEQQVGGAAQLVDLPGDLSADLFYRGINRVQVDRDRDGFPDLARRRLTSGGANLYRGFF